MAFSANNTLQTTFNLQQTAQNHPFSSLIHCWLLSTCILGQYKNKERNGKLSWPWMTEIRWKTHSLPFRPISTRKADIDQAEAYSPTSLSLASETLGRLVPVWKFFQVSLPLLPTIVVSSSLFKGKRDNARQIIKSPLFSHANLRFIHQRHIILV